MKAYMGTAEVEETYRIIKGSEKGMRNFIRESRSVATRTKKGAFIYMDEPALYEVFKKHLEVEFQNRGIDCFGRLMQATC